MIDSNLTYAVIGASNDENKYGYKIFRDLTENGYHTVPINPNEKKILRQKVYPTLTSYKKKIDVAIFVVPPKITEVLLPEVKALQIPHVWMQPGSESDAAISFCEKNNIDCTHNACIMVQRSEKKPSYFS